VEDEAEGVLVCDGSIGDLGAVPAPVTMRVSGGQVTEVQCADEAFARRVREVISVDPGASRIGEFGIGLNPGARVTGNLLEDEKALRTIHVAFGNNTDMGGGRNHSKTHRDFLVLAPTLEVTFQDGRTERVMVGGEIVPRNRPRNPAEPHRFHHLLVAVDYSEASIEALPPGGSPGPARRCPVDRVPRPPDARDGEPPVPPLRGDAGHGHPPGQRTERGHAAGTMVRENTPPSPRGLPILILWGDAPVRIIEAAEQRGADLLVLANRGTGDWRGGPWKRRAHVAPMPVPVLLVR
jgi:hypothetical protein